MGPLIIALFITSGICLAVAALHLTIFLRRRDLKVDLFFAVMSLCAAGGAFFETMMHQAASAADFVQALKIQLTFHGVLWIFLVWFIVFYTGTARRLLAMGVSAAYGVAVIINIVSPYGVIYSTVGDLVAVTLPWGEQIRFLSGSLNPWRYLPDAAWLLLIYLAAESCVRLYRRGHRFKSILLGSTLLFFLGFAYLHGTLSDLGLVGPPPVMSFTFLGLIVVMSLSLTGEVVRASVLSREVAANERRWRSLLENVHLMVIGVGADEQVNYVNPHFTKVSGFSQEEVLGKSLPNIFAEPEREDLRERFQSAMDGDIWPHTTRALITRDGENRLIRFSHVILRDANERIIGTLSIGEDITDQKQAEEARDHAIEELEALKKKLEEENIFLREEISSQHGFEEIVGKTNALLYVLSRVEQITDTNTTVLIQGETGVGKELIARAVHQTGRRSEQVLITLNCAALPENLVESELFGHEAGAFTGANRLRKGRFELADGGTIFLDEISELSLDTQAKLLRVLQDGLFERLGGSEILKTDVRVIAATNRNLDEAVAAGRFRADLFYRLNVYPVTVPPLRSRKDDIPLLVQHFVAQIASQIGKPINQVPPHVMDRLVEYDWPGNVRELKNVLERAVITSAGSVLTLPESLGPTPAAQTEVRPRSEKTLSLEAVEKQHILSVLQSTDWRISGPKGAAKILGLNPSTLRFRMKKLEIRKNNR